VDVAQFLHALFFAVDRKVVVSRLPERPFAAAHGYRELERVHHAGRTQSRAHLHSKQIRNKQRFINKLSRNHMPNQCISPKSVPFSTTFYLD
jgi:hypothetical protein